MTTSTLIIDVPAPGCDAPDTLETAILEQINEQAVIGLDALVTLMPEYSWNQIFQAVDRLARCGKIVLRRHRFEYNIFSNHYAA